MKIRVVVIEEHEYDSIKRKVGDTYDADPRFLSLLTELKRVKVVEPESPQESAKRNEYRRRDMKAEK